MELLGYTLKNRVQSGVYYYEIRFNNENAIKENDFGEIIILLDVLYLADVGHILEKNAFSSSLV